MEDSYNGARLYTNTIITILYRLHIKQHDHATVGNEQENEIEKKTNGCNNANAKRDDGETSKLLLPMMNNVDDIQIHPWKYQTAVRNLQMIM
ncbi:hypothetical protein KPH14_006535 [Odynerus spinipes]|uniref:Uncharacterized protein n=1 Tax=Odynerus spinipes TaxID=1348599 RepID=A0AAD9RQL8_9HYME|nr:hypothetical protein KPH14_006535 [Odynerus spinipes]